MDMSNEAEDAVGSAPHLNPTAHSARKCVATVVVPGCTIV